MRRCHRKRTTVSSDYARAMADIVAAAASEQLITTWDSEEGYGKVWRPTAHGLRFLEGDPL